jgi:capsular polysaccharide export protein
LTTSARTFLFLQGACSPFHRRLARRLTEGGHRVVKVHYAAGDIAFWQRKLGPSHLFRDRLERLPEFIAELWQRYDVTDQLVFGDRRPVHRAAVEMAPARGIRTHVIEEGYFRPHWITLEREGVNGHSLLPRNADWYRYTAAKLPPPLPPVRFRSPFRTRATQDVLYHLAGLGNPVLFPHYRNHAPVTAPVEYAGYIKRLTQLRWWKPRDRKRIIDLARSRRPYFVLPLQLNSDAQIRDHSPFSNMREVIELTLRSFAAHAPGNAILCVKNHPLDMGLISYKRLLSRLAKHLDIEDRLVYLESGDLNILLKRAAGTVTVNSTTGIVSLEHSCPTLALSDPIYRLQGLTHHGGLDDFWSAPTAPDPSLFQAFRRTLMHTVQFNGGLYCRPGVLLAVDNVARQLGAERSALELLL